MIYRPHRLLLTESMDESVEIKDLNELLKHLQNTLVGYDKEKVSVKYYCYDKRLSAETWIVSDDLGVLGFIT